MSVHRHQGGRLQERASDGRFVKPDAIGTCPRCHQPVTSPELPKTRPVDPVLYNARVCVSCGWDSRKPL
jgi:hypothetical protein